MSEILKEAFKELQSLKEDTFSFDKEGIFNLDKFLKFDDVAPDTISVIDPAADSEDQLQKSYEGDVILKCCVCGQLIYKDTADVVIDPDLQRANVEEDCPHCGCVGGYEVVGQVTPYVDVRSTEVKIDDQPIEIQEDPTAAPIEEGKPLEESVDSKPSIANYFKDVDEGEGWVTLDFAAEYLERSEDEIADWLDKHPTVGYIYNIEDIQVICTPHAPSFDFIAAELGITEYEGKEDLNESISKRDRDIIIDAVKGEFETGHGYIEDKDEFEEMLGRRLTAAKYEELKDFYSELQELGPEGFYEEYKDKLEFDPDFVEEYGYNEDDEDDDDEDLDESLNEDFHKATVETGDSTLSMETDENGKITVTSEPRKAEEEGEEMITPVTDDTKAEIAAANEEEVTEPVEEETSEVETEEAPAEDELDLDLDEVDEDSFNELGESYFHKVYDNVQGFKLTNGSVDGDKILLEGIITFNSGKQARTRFLFEGYAFNKKGKLKFIGENAQISNRKNAFALQGRVEGKKLITESFTYNYRARDAKTGKNCTLYGTVKNKN